MIWGISLYLDVLDTMESVINPRRLGLYGEFPQSLTWDNKRGKGTEGCEHSFYIIIYDHVHIIHYMAITSKI